MGSLSADAASTTDVVIVGAGPVGLLIALGLGRAGINTTVLEAHHELLPTTRAMVYMPVVLSVLRELGIYDAISKEAYLNTDGICWRDINGKELGRLNFAEDDSGDFNGVLLLGQWRLNEIILKALLQYPSVNVKFGTRVVGVDNAEQADTVKVMTHTGHVSNDDEFYHAKYVVGTDGANSAIRRMLCIPFEGFTFPDMKMIGCDVVYDFTEKERFPRLNFVVDEVDWAVVAYTGADEGRLPHGSGRPLWRIAYGEDSSLPTDQDGYLERARERVQKYMNKGDRDFKLVRAEPYWMHQRVAGTARKGRVLLAGDALHSNNPIGGLGLTSGILDAFCYGNALGRVLVGGEPDDLLSVCAAARRQAWIDSTDTLSQTNFKRLYGVDEQSVKQRESFLANLNDPAQSKSFATAVRRGFDKMMPEDFTKKSA